MVYIVFVVLMFMLALLCFGRHFNVYMNKNLFLIIMTIMCIVLMGFRDVSVGADTHTYMEYFEIIKGSSFPTILSGWMYTSMEVGYCLLMKICSLFSESYYFFQIVEAIIMSCLIARFIKNNTQNYWQAYVIYIGLGLYLTAFNITRQMLAAAIAINAGQEIKNKNILRSLVILFLATTVHSAALVFAIAYIIYSIRRYPILSRIAPIIIITVAMNFQTILICMRPYLSRFGNYLGNTRAISTVGGVLVIWFIIVVISIYLLYSSIKKGKIKKAYNKAIPESIIDYSQNRAVAIFCLMYIACNIIGLFFNYFERVGLFFAPYAIPLFEMFGQKLTNTQTRRFYSAAMVGCFLGYFLISALTSKQYTYTFFFL